MSVDFTPSPDWPPMYQGRLDTLRLRYVTDPALHAVELSLTDGGGVVLATRR